MSLPTLKNIELTYAGTSDKVLVATMKRPEALNALNQDSLDSLSKLCDYVAGDEMTRVLVVTGHGEKSFVAGADIKGFEEMGSEAAQVFAEQGQKVFTKLSELEKPVLAAVNGFALGGGLELALACDLIVASEKAKFALPECKLGLIPGFGGTVRLARRVGTAKAMEMALTGNMVSAAEAMNAGLCVKVVPPADVVKATIELADTMVLRAPRSLSFIKRSIYEGQEKSVYEAQKIEARFFGEVFKTKDKTEGVKAFIEGREPKFIGS